MKFIVHNLYTFVLISLITIISITQVILVNSDSTQGDKITTLTKEIKILEEENDRIIQKIASYSAISTLSLQAHMYGYTNQGSTLSLTGPLPLALSEHLSL